MRGIPPVTWWYHRTALPHGRQAFTSRLLRLWVSDADVTEAEKKRTQNAERQRRWRQRQREKRKADKASTAQAAAPTPRRATPLREDSHSASADRTDQSRKVGELRYDSWSEKQLAALDGEPQTVTPPDVVVTPSITQTGSGGAIGPSEPPQLPEVFVCSSLLGQPVAGGPGKAPKGPYPVPTPLPAGVSNAKSSTKDIKSFKSMTTSELTALHDAAKAMIVDVQSEQESRSARRRAIARPGWRPGETFGARTGGDTLGLQAAPYVAAQQEVELAFLATWVTAVRARHRGPVTLTLSGAERVRLFQSYTSLRTAAGADAISPADQPDKSCPAFSRWLVHLRAVTAAHASSASLTVGDAARLVVERERRVVCVSHPGRMPTAEVVAMFQQSAGEELRSGTLAILPAPPGYLLSLALDTVRSDR